jgi:transposase InsO family protein
VLKALDMAIDHRNPGPCLIHHSDRGLQYTCDVHRAKLTAYGMLASMSRKGDCWDNAVAESFFSTLKIELVRRCNFHSRAEAHAALDAIARAFVKLACMHGAPPNLRS